MYSSSTNVHTRMYTERILSNVKYLGVRIDE